MTGLAEEVTAGAERPGDPGRTPPGTLVVFGVTGDLARTKLLPAVYDLANRGLLAPEFVLLGFGRRDWDDAAFTSFAGE